MIAYCNQNYSKTEVRNVGFVNNCIQKEEEMAKLEIKIPRRSKGGSRRYKTPSPQLLRMRRQAANARERRRMNNLNDAFDKLRTVLPSVGTGRRLSKFETLQMAQQYIDCLAELMEQSYDTLYDNTPFLINLIITAQLTICEF
ncbi:unnamed protein product [Onchocerca flexuosa]|uniref:BHLH domain-containing protein n=1 Tax=Onchocerca flexuosa TaxID=387005 RepID=A0A183I0P9_9BILA|nr:unnamed protein product [Onchocerca flexuosa]